jgi:MYXO-CTERM domain-containing protein
MGRLPVNRRAAVVLVAALLGWLAGVPTASAHERLEASEPAADAVLTEVPGRVQLTFSGAVSSPTLVLRAGSGDQVSDGEPLLDGALVTLPLQPDLPNGAYTVEWRVVSSDGDPVSGSYAFTLETPGTAAPAPSSAVSATSSSPSAMDTRPIAVVDGGNPSVGPWLAAGAAMLAVLVGLLAVRRRRTGGSAGERPDR